MSYAAGFGRKATQIEYLVHRHSNVEFQVKKLADGETLLETYTVVIAQHKQPRCDCMAWITGKTRPCKHALMVAKFIQAGEPPVFVLPKE